MTLKDVCELIVDCPHSTANDEGKGYPLIRTPNVGKGRLKLDEVHRVSRAVYDERNARAVPRSGDLILAREAPAGNVAVIQEGQNVCLGQRTVLIRPKEDIDPSFLAYYLLTPEQQYRLLGTANGATVAHVNLPVIRNLQIDLPDFDTQKKLGRVLANYDDLIENNNRQIKLLEEAAQRLYKEWFVDLHFPGYEDCKIVDGVPEGWRRCSLEEMCSLRKSTVKAEEIRAGEPYIGLEHMPRRNFCLSQWGNAAEVNSNKARYFENDIIFGKIRPYFHKVGFAINSGVTSTDTFIMCPHDGIWGLVLMLVSSDAFVDYTYKTCKEGSKMPRADWNQMKKYESFIADETVQNTFEQKLKTITQSIKALVIENHLLTEARDRLLPKLMSGEIEV